MVVATHQRVHVVTFIDERLQLLRTITKPSFQLSMWTMTDEKLIYARNCDFHCGGYDLIACYDQIIEDFAPDALDQGLDDDDPDEVLDGGLAELDLITGQLTKQLLPAKNFIVSFSYHL